MAVSKKKVSLTARQRRQVKVRKTVRGSVERPRVCAFRSSKHMYAQVICDSTGVVLASASTRDKEVTSRISKVEADGLPNDSRSTKSMAAAHAVGLVIAERCKAKNLEKVVFDRNGFLFHGRIKALADGARAGGLDF